MKRSLPLVTLIALGAAAYAPLPSMAQDVQLYIGTAPPAPLYERMPSARRGHVWVPGYWAWNGRRHHWMPGTYIVERPGYVYAPPAWQQRGGRWYMQQGGWAPHRGDRYAYGGGYQRDGYYGHPQQYRGRDRDRDGIPDRYERRGRDFDRDGIPNARDRDLDNDGVRNRRDRDRDGDGRPNHRDDRPDNPYRR